MVNDKFKLDLPPREFALLHWFADMRKQGKEGVVAPTKKWNDADVELKNKIDQLTYEFNHYYADLKNVNDDLRVDKAFFETVKTRLKEMLDHQLGLELSAKIAITQDKRGQPFYLNLNPQYITIIDSFKH